ncbi:hypothetical protein ACFFRL_01535 [Agromyces hippuratus]
MPVPFSARTDAAMIDERGREWTTPDLTWNACAFGSLTLSRMPVPLQR